MNFGNRLPVGQAASNGRLYFALPSHIQTHPVTTNGELAVKLLLSIAIINTKEKRSESICLTMER